MSRNVNFKNLTNQKFGYLTAISLDEVKSTYNHTYWICECVCGNTRSLQTYQLTSGKVTSCGCMNAKTIKSEYISEKNAYSISIMVCVPVVAIQNLLPLSIMARKG